ncbi:MAG TPA: glycosyltransferase family 2 protein [Candidatus Saccharimonadales bacterium]|nr:glycosyltransferase family 2 protein [Candidatus Saccharimonadales bacterium]
MKKVSIVTVNFNTADDTTALLQSLRHVRTDGFTIETIVVDNASKEVYEIPDRLKNDSTILIRSDVNTGFSGGNNIGMKEALKRGADYILIVNNDTEMDRDLIVNLLKVLDSDPKIGVTTPKIYFAKGHEFHKDKYKPSELGKVFWFAGGYTDWNNVISIHRGVDEVDHGQYDTTEKIEFATGCCMLFKREVLDKIGLFDDRYFLYYEDADLNERIKRAGYKIYYVPSAVLIHINAASSGGAGNGNVLQDYFITRNKMLFGMTYAPTRTKLALFRESMRLLRTGRLFQKLAIRDYYARRFNKGTFFEKRAKIEAKNK